MTGTREEMACHTCLVPLDALGDPPAYVHPIHLPSDGHPPTPVPVSQLDTVHRMCDFCSDEYPVWTLTGGEAAVVALGHNVRLRQDFGPSWVACATCSCLLNDGRPDKVFDRAVANLGLRGDPAGRTRIERLHRAFLEALQPGQNLITTTAWPPTTLTARDMPKVRDRLTGLYRGPHGIPAAVINPGRRGMLADSLERAWMCWIDEDFTDLAAHAGTQLPDVAVDRDAPPAPHGLLAWSRPLTPAAVTAVSWAEDDSGWHLVAYRAIGAGLDGKALQFLREHVGWLMPMASAHIGHAAPVRGGHVAVPVLVATWLLIAQQAADISRAEIDKAVRKRYARTHRPAPQVRIVRIRTHHGPTPHGATSSVRREAREPTNRVWVTGHWRNQPYGPGRALRRPVYINPFLRGPDDAPIKLSTTVRILGNHTPPHTQK